MRRLLSLLGTLFDAILGPNYTYTYTSDEYRSKTHCVRPDDPSIDPTEVYVVSRRLVFLTQYTRFWIPNAQQVVFVVRGHAPESYRGKLPDVFWAEVTYPLLCNPMLKWTRYPHVYAIRAFLQRIYPKTFLSTFI